MIILFTVLFPILTGLLLPVFKFNKRNREIYSLLVTVLNSIIIYYLVFGGNEYSFTVLNFLGKFSISFYNDSLSKVFLMLIATLWPIATFYSFEYMEHLEKKDSFFKYYIMNYGIAVGFALSDNLISMYFFYELLTFMTLPLIMHNLEDKKSLYAGRVYLTVSILGASIALMGIIILSMYTGTVNFRYGGMLSNSILGGKELLYIGYLLCFLGFGVKAALFPFTFWLPICGVAPTPVSALLHAVAVVKAGVFAIMRVVFYSFGIEFLNGTLVQKITMGLAIFTIIFASIMAIKEKNLKKRLAYSTASNLSYMLFAITLMNSDGLYSSLLHMLFHAIMKINLFFIAGAIIIYAKKEYVNDLKGLAYKMPISFFCFTVSSLGMIGIPITCGFISKFAIAEAAINSNIFLSNIGLIAIVISAICTAVYLLPIVIGGYFPGEKFDKSLIKDARDPNLYMLITFIILTIMIIFFGLYSGSLVDFIKEISSGAMM